MHGPKHLISELVVLNGYPLIGSELFLATNGYIYEIEFVTSDRKVSKDLLRGDK